MFVGLLAKSQDLFITVSEVSNSCYKYPVLDTVLHSLLVYLGFLYLSKRQLFLGLENLHFNEKKAGTTGQCYKIASILD